MDQIERTAKGCFPKLEQAERRAIGFKFVQFRLKGKARAIAKNARSRNQVGVVQRLAPRCGPRLLLLFEDRADLVQRARTRYKLIEHLTHIGRGREVFEVERS